MSNDWTFVVQYVWYINRIEKKKKQLSISKSEYQRKAHFAIGKKHTVHLFSMDFNGSLFLLAQLMVGCAQFQFAVSFCNFITNFLLVEMLQSDMLTVQLMSNIEFIARESLATKKQIWKNVENLPLKCQYISIYYLVVSVFYTILDYLFGACAWYFFMRGWSVVWGIQKPDKISDYCGYSFI